MLHRHLLLPALLVPALAASAQSGMLKPVPAWKPGERRQVEVDRKLRITLDSAQHEVAARATYRVDVVQVAKYEMVLEIRTLATTGLEAQSRLGQLLRGTAPGTRQQARDEVLEGLYAQLDGLPTQYRVATDGTVLGQVDAVKAVEKLRPAMAKLMPAVLKDIAARGGGEAGALTAARVDFLTDSIYNALVAPQAIALHQFLQIYAFSFPLSGAQRAQVKLKQLRAPWGQVVAELPVMAEAGLDQHDAKQATTRRILNFPVAEWQAAMVKATWNDGAKPEDSSWTEETVEEYDRDKAWPMGSTSETHFRCGQLRMHNTVRTAAKKVL